MIKLVYIFTLPAIILLVAAIERQYYVTHDIRWCGRANQKTMGSDRCVRLPTGIFRGLRWSSNPRGSFRAWILNGPRPYIYWYNGNAVEQFVEIAGPKGSGKWVWTEEKPEVTASSQNGMWQLFTVDEIELRLPASATSYQFTYAEDDSGLRVLTFHNPDDSSIISGVFGYVVLSKP